MELQNKIMLITYADSLGKNLSELSAALDKYFAKAIGGLHILPFFPSSGDRGFAPTRYDMVAPAFGDFSDIRALSKKYCLIFDFMVNHISRQSAYFKDYLKKGKDSPWRDLFLDWDAFWPPGRPTAEDVDVIYKRKPKAPVQEVTFADGSKGKVWCTFSDEQIDLDVRTDVTRRFIADTIVSMCQNGAGLIRLDAFAYAVKKPGASCFFVEPEIWELLGWIGSLAAPLGAALLPEIHEHYSIQLKLAEKGYWVYDFALPMLVLHALYTGRGDRLRHWLDICPRRQFTTLDTHDGIGVVDVADLLTPEEIDQTKELLFARGANVKKKYNTAAYNNLDIYQINCTYYSALGDKDQAYLLARAIQFFAPGIPQVYYVGMLAGKNDIELLERTKEGRNINRHGYTLEELERETARPVVRQLLNLMAFRNTCPAFALDGEIETTAEGSRFCILRRAGGVTARLDADLKTHAFSVEETCGGEIRRVL